jgi:beta-glucosidase
VQRAGEVRDRVGEVLARLALEEKVALTAGEDMWHTPPVERAGIPRFKVTDGPVGARGARFGGGPPSACFPCGTALAATWDVDLVRRVGEALGEETRAKGAHVLLAPTVNIHRHPLAGRSFECYSEDPHLTAGLAVAAIDGIQSRGVGACIKHLVANDSEFERHTISSEVPERALREIYLRPFEVAVAEADPVAVMGAYNKLAGTWCCEHPRLLTTILRDEWTYDGLVLSDWWATHSTAESASAGLDLEMPGPTLFRGSALVEAVQRGELDEAVVDRMAGNVLAAMARTGALDGGPGEERWDDDPERRRVARRAAAAAVVLLVNEPVDGEPVLPLDAAAGGTLAVIGPGAASPNLLGGGSAAVSMPYAVTPLDGIRARAGHALEVRHEPGGTTTPFPPPLDVRWTTTPDGRPGIAVQYLDEREEVAGGITSLRPVLVTADAPPHLRAGPWSVRARCTVRPPSSGPHRWQVGATGSFELRVDGEVVVDGRDLGPAGRGRREGTSVLDTGTGHDVELRWVPPPDGDAMAGLELRCLVPMPDDPVTAAVEAARAADTVVLVVGTNGDTETEGRDRRTMDLPGGQDALVEAVAAANPRTVVVVNAGAPVAMPWADRVPALAQSWFGGMEAGNGLADVLFGDADAEGRLPTTLPARLEDAPAFTAYPGEHGRVHYGEGVFVGYRWYDARRIEPRFPFGHGLSYTTFGYGPPEAALDGERVRVAVDVSNTGDRPGAETVQVYVTPRDPVVPTPPKGLAGFTKVRLDPGESRRVEVVLDDRALDHWDVDAGGWRRTASTFEVLVGASSRDIRARVPLITDGA